MSEFSVMGRRKITINTDPQRRCYDGRHFSEKTIWSEWRHIVDLPTREEAEASARTYKVINPGRQYKVEEHE